MRKSLHSITVLSNMLVLPISLIDSVNFGEYRYPQFYPIKFLYRTHVLVVKNSSQAGFRTLLWPFLDVLLRKNQTAQYS